MVRRSRIAIFTVSLAALAIAVAIGGLGLPFSRLEASTSGPETLNDATAYEQAILEDEAVFAAVLLTRCSEASEPFVISTTPADAAEDTVEHAGPFREAKLAMLRRSPGYFGKSESRAGDRILIPAQCTEAIPASEVEIRRALAVPIAARQFKDRPAFQARFPGASSVMWLSMPGYSRDGLHAVVYLSGGCGGLCGSGFSVTVQKTKGGWTMVGSEMAWIS